MTLVGVFDNKQGGRIDAASTKLVGNLARNTFIA